MRNLSEVNLSFSACIWHKIILIDLMQGLTLLSYPLVLNESKHIWPSWFFFFPF